MFGGIANFRGKLLSASVAWEVEGAAYGDLEEGEDGPGYQIDDFPAVKLTGWCIGQRFEVKDRRWAGTYLKGATVIGPVYGAYGQRRALGLIDSDRD